MPIIYGICRIFRRNREKFEMNSRIDRLLKEFSKRYQAQDLFDPIKIVDYEVVESHGRLPAWWSANGNFLVRPRGVTNGIPHIQLHPGHEKCSNFILICNGEHDYGLLVWGDGGLMYIAQEASIAGANIALESGCVYCGPHVRHTARLNLNCRNGGAIFLRRDVLIASDVIIQTDDCHTLFSVAERKRLNPYGGVIDIDDHVWIGQESMVMGNSKIGRDSIIGARSFVRGGEFPSNVVLAGSPARVISSGVNWDFRDLPPAVAPTLS
jgi:carbonic anhydrase/acetyltransferase-like protein (isoleucine patch superfamily)